MVAVEKAPVRAIGVFSLETLALKDINADGNYQRNPSPKMIEFIIDHFNQLLCGPLYVGRRADGTQWVIDGATRLAALKARNVSLWPCIVANTTAEQEAKLFIDLNEFRRAVKPVEKFKARLFSNDEVAQAIDAAVEAHGFTIGEGARGIASVRTLESLHGNGRLSEVLDVMATYWSEEATVTDGTVLRGLGLLFGQLRWNKKWGRGRKDILNRDRLDTVLKTHGLAEIKRKAAEMKAVLSGSASSNARVFADSIVFFYNKGIAADKRLRFTYE